MRIRFTFIFSSFSDHVKPKQFFADTFHFSVLRKEKIHKVNGLHSVLKQAASCSFIKFQNCFFCLVVLKIPQDSIR